ncbi:UDP-glycosyltransferase 73C6 [Hordeum vulgare]|nr:UDP-glycosyltransferase 73C6 [Hordeum vulgare]
MRAVPPPVPASGSNGAACSSAGGSASSSGSGTACSCVDGSATSNDSGAVCPCSGGGGGRGPGPAPVKHDVEDEPTIPEVAGGRKPRVQLEIERQDVRRHLILHRCSRPFVGTCDTVTRLSQRFHRSESMTLGHGTGSLFSHRQTMIGGRLEREPQLPTVGQAEAQQVPGTSTALAKILARDEPPATSKGKAKLEFPDVANLGVDAPHQEYLTELCERWDADMSLINMLKHKYEPLRALQRRHKNRARDISGSACGAKRHHAPLVSCARSCTLHTRAPAPLLANSPDGRPRRPPLTLPYTRKPATAVATADANPSAGSFGFASTGAPPTTDLAYGHFMAPPTTSTTGGVASAPAVKPRSILSKLPNGEVAKTGKVCGKKNEAVDDSSRRPKRLTGRATDVAATKAPASSLAAPTADAHKLTIGQNLFQGEEMKTKKGKIKKGRSFTLPHYYDVLKDYEKWKPRERVNDESNKRKQTIDLDDDDEEASSDDGKRSVTLNSIAYSKPKRPYGGKKDAKEKKKRKGDDELKILWTLL